LSFSFCVFVVFSRLQSTAAELRANGAECVKGAGWPAIYKRHLARHSMLIAQLPSNPLVLFLISVPISLFLYAILNRLLYNTHAMEVLTDPAIASANPASTPADMDYLSYLFYRALGSKQQAPQSPPPPSGPSPPTTPTTPTSPGKRSPRKTSRSKRQAKQPPAQSRCKQPYDAFLVFDVEATCIQNVDFNRDWNRNGRSLFSDGQTKPMMEKQVVCSRSTNSVPTSVRRIVQSCRPSAKN